MIALSRLAMLRICNLSGSGGGGGGCGHGGIIGVGLGCLFVLVLVNVGVGWLVVLVAVAVMSHDATGMASFFSALPVSWKLVRLPEFIWGHQAVEVVMATGIQAEKPYFGASAFVKGCLVKSAYEEDVEVQAQLSRFYYMHLIWLRSLLRLRGTF